MRTFRDIIRILQCLSSTLERRKADKLYDFAKFAQIRERVLNIFRFGGDMFRQLHLEESVARGRLEQGVGDRHLGFLFPRLLFFCVVVGMWVRLRICVQRLWRFGREGRKQDGVGPVSFVRSFVGGATDDDEQKLFRSPITSTTPFWDESNLSLSLK